MSSNVNKRDFTPEEIEVMNTQIERLTGIKVENYTDEEIDNMLPDQQPAVVEYEKTADEVVEEIKLNGEVITNHDELEEQELEATTESFEPVGPSLSIQEMTDLNIETNNISTADETEIVSEIIIQDE